MANWVASREGSGRTGKESGREGCHAVGNGLAVHGSDALGMRCKAVHRARECVRRVSRAEGARAAGIAARGGPPYFFRVAEKIVNHSQHTLPFTAHAGVQGSILLWREVQTHSRVHIRFLGGLYTIEYCFGRGVRMEEVAGRGAPPSQPPARSTPSPAAPDLEPSASATAAAASTSVDRPSRSTQPTAPAQGK